MTSRKKAAVKKGDRVENYRTGRLHEVIGFTMKGGIKRVRLLNPASGKITATTMESLRSNYAF